MKKIKRKRLQSPWRMFVDSHGLRYSYVAEQLGITPDIHKHWLQGRMGPRNEEERLAVRLFVHRYDETVNLEDLFGQKEG